MRWPAVLLLATGCARATATIAPAVPRASTDERPHGTVQEDTFRSDALGATKHLVIYLPPSYGRDRARRYAVAYYLHGLSGSETDWISKGGLDATADSIFASGAPELIIVMPDGDDGWYSNWAQQVSFASCADTVHVESPERYCVARERYEDYVASDVVRWVDSHYRTRPEPDHRGIAGLSMGGYGAIELALRHADVFGAAASHSGVLSMMYTGPHPFREPVRYGETLDEIRPSAGSFWPRYLLYWGANLDRWRASDPAHSAELAVRRGQRLPALFFDCGTEDGFIDQNRAFHSELTRLGIAHQYAEWPGAHTWRYWSTHSAESLAWMARRIN